MRTIWDILIIISMATIFVLGLINVGETVFINQELSQESIEELAKYSNLASDFQYDYNERFNKTNVDPYLEPNLNDVEGFVQEYRDYKGKLDQLKDTVLLVYKLPDFLFNVVPFVDFDDTLLYADVLRILIWSLILLIFIVGIKNGALI